MLLRRLYNVHLLILINLDGILFIYYENVLRFEIFKPILIYSTNIFKQFIFETYVCAMTFYLKDEYGNIARQAAWYLCCLSKFASHEVVYGHFQYGIFHRYYFALKVFPLEFCVSGIQTFKNKLGANVYLVNLFRKNLKDKRQNRMIINQLIMNDMQRSRRDRLTFLGPMFYTYARFYSHMKPSIYPEHLWLNQFICNHTLFLPSY